MDSCFRRNDINSNVTKPKCHKNDIDIYQMPSKNDSVKEIFSRLSGKYRINRIIDNYGYGEGIAYFLQLNSQSFRQDKFKSKPAERTKVREQRLDSKKFACIKLCE